MLAVKNLENSHAKDIELVGINHDIDLMRLPRLYIDAIQRRYENRIRAVGPAYAQTKHAFDPLHPLISRAVYWKDFVYSQAQIGYEAGAVIPMSLYALQMGFDSSHRTHEVGSLVGSTGRLIRTGHLETSPRRYVARLAANGFSRIWTDQSFGTTDGCRDQKAMQEKKILLKNNSCS